MMNSTVIIKTIIKGGYRYAEKKILMVGKADKLVWAGAVKFLRCCLRAINVKISGTYQRKTRPSRPTMGPWVF